MGSALNVYTPAVQDDEATFSARKKKFIDFAINNSNPQHDPGGSQIPDKKLHYQLVRMFNNSGEKPPVEINWATIETNLDRIARREDTSDFMLLAFVRMLYQFPGQIPPDKLTAIQDTLYSFKYWPNETGKDGMCYWSENHSIMFSSNQFLIGQKYKETCFSSPGKKGAELMAEARERIITWLTMRYRTGFCEWLSNLYYNEDMPALLNLVDFSEDGEIAAKAAIVMDLLLFDIALNSLRGVFCSTHGRTHAPHKMYFYRESTIDAQRLLFGMGLCHMTDNKSSAALALAVRYKVPAVLNDIAADTECRMINRQKTGIKIDEYARWGFDLENLNDVFRLLEYGAYLHPSVIEAMVNLFNTWNIWDSGFFNPNNSKTTAKMITIARWILNNRLPYVKRFIEENLDLVTPTTLQEVDICTFKTPAYMLSSAQDYRNGSLGAQQSIWQAGLTPSGSMPAHDEGPGYKNPTCFVIHKMVNNPFKKPKEGDEYFGGFGILPSVVQVENVLMAQYATSIDYPDKIRDILKLVTEILNPSHRISIKNFADTISRLVRAEKNVSILPDSVVAGMGEDSRPVESKKPEDNSTVTLRDVAKAYFRNGSSPARSIKGFFQTARTLIKYYLLHESSTHAYFPGNSFDEYETRGRWTFARSGTGFIALYSRNDFFWQKIGIYADKEIIAPGKNNVWICEMGSGDAGEFGDFMNGVAGSAITVTGSAVQYDSPSQGRLVFDLKRGNLQVTNQRGDEIVDSHSSPRYDNTYISPDTPCGFPLQDKVTIVNQGKRSFLEIDFARNIRNSSGYI
ncbi:MAG: hypothetical protein EPN93_11475 [Spirochaetes bacterium]|nr:MAG: hypothetical protein EPN93_11475 [Spirochaetota bacterium]